MSVTAGVVGLSLMILSPVSLPGTSDPVPTCQGRPATIVASSGTAYGTDGDDVILATGVANVLAQGGNDTICVAGGYVDAGPGDDSVLTTGGEQEQASLGSGTNHYTSTGAGTSDYVGSGSPDEPDTDVIDLGTGHDELDLRPTPGSYVHATAGGDATLVVVATSGPGDHWRARLPDRIARDGRAIGTFSGFSANTFNIGRSSSLFAKGGPEADDVTANLRGRLDLFLGGGGDTVHLVGAKGGLPRSGVLDLGRGRNRLDVDANHVDLDLGRHRLTVDRHTHLRIAGVVSAVLLAKRVHYVGTASADVASIQACAGRARGAGGADRLSYARLGGPAASPVCPHSGLDLEGGPGNDRLVGGPGPDRLIGGPGHDLAFGEGGIDVCQAELRRKCER